MEVKLDNLLKAFGKDSKETKLLIIQLFKSGLRPKFQMEGQILAEIKKPLNPHEQLLFESILQNIKLSKRQNLLYTLLQLQILQSKRMIYQDFDFEDSPKDNQPQFTKMQIQQQPVDILSDLTARMDRSVQPTLKIGSPISESVMERENRFKHQKLQQTNIESIIQQVEQKFPAEERIQPLLQEQTLFQNLCHLLQGIHGNDVKFQTSPVTGLFVPQITENKIYKTQLQYCQLIGETGGLYLQIQQQLKRLRESASKYRLQFVAFAEQQLAQYMQLLQSEMQNNNESLQHLYLLTMQKLRPKLLFVVTLAEDLLLTKGADALKLVKQTQFLGNIQYVQEREALNRHFEQVTASFVRAWILSGEIIDPEFYIQKSDNAKIENRFKDEFLIQYADVVEHEGMIFNLGRNVHFLREHLGQISYEFANLRQGAPLVINAQLLSQLLRQSAKSIRDQLFNDNKLLQVFQLINRVFLGFSSDFLTGFAELQQQNAYTQANQQLHKLAAINQLDGCVQQSNLRFLLDKSVLQLLSVKFQNETVKSEFTPSLTLEKPLNLIILAKEQTSLEQFFQLVYNLRRLELQILSDSSQFSGVKQILNGRNLSKAVRKEVKALLSQTFKLQHLLRHFSTFVMIQFERQFNLFQEYVEQNWDNVDIVTVLITGLEQFCSKLHESVLDGALITSIQTIWTQYTQFGMAAIQAIESQSFTQLGQMCYVFGNDIAKALTQIKHFTGTREEEIDLFIDGINW